MYLSIYLQSASLKRKQFCESSSIFEVGNIKNEAILRDLLNFRSWQHQTRSYSARLPQFRSWQHQKRSTSAILPHGNIKNEAIQWDVLQKWKVECMADGLVPIGFAIFPLHLSKVLRLPRKIDSRSYEVAAPVTQKSSHQTYTSDAPKCNPSQEISALTS